MFKAKDKGLFILYLRKIFRKTNISHVVFIVTFEWINLEHNIDLVHWFSTVSNYIFAHVIDCWINKIKRF